MRAAARWLTDPAARDGFSLFLSMRRSGRAWAMDLVGSLSFREWCGSRGPVNLREELSVFSSLFLPLSAVAYPVGPPRRMEATPDIDHSAHLSRTARMKIGQGSCRERWCKSVLSS